VLTEDSWVPLYARISEAGASEFARLHPGVPLWMRESLWEWLRKQLSILKGSASREYWDPVPELIREVERICRIEIHWLGSGSDYTDRLKGLNALRLTLYENDVAFLTAIDFRLSREGIKIDVVQELEWVLGDAASEWRVAKIEDRWILVHRVDETVQQAAEALAQQGTRPGKLLSDAWRHAFSMHRDASASYRCSVRAVEAAAGPILTPSDPRPSLGKMITALRDGMKKWNFAFTVDSAVEPKQVLLEMMQLLWTNEYSRHVGADPAAPLNVSQREAESAVVLALTLVNWFTSGAVTCI